MTPDSNCNYPIAVHNYFGKTVYLCGRPTICGCTTGVPDFQNDPDFKPGGSMHEAYQKWLADKNK